MLGGEFTAFQGPLVRVLPSAWPLPHGGRCVMTTRRVGVLVLLIVCLGGVAMAQEDEVPLSNWGAPPYWTPPVQAAEGEPGGGMTAHVLGMTTQAEALPSSPLPFVAITPCRIVDTRVAVSDGFHQPNFSDGETRTFTLPASTDCTGLPATAGAWSLNVQFRPISLASYITLFPTGTTMPAVSTLTASPAAWVEDAAIVPAGTGGAIDVYCQFAGRVIIDINGYYGPQSVVTSLNTLTGDVTLAQGSNVTITPSGNTLTIAATGGPGGELPAGSTNQTLRNNGSAWTASSALTNDGSNVGVAGNLLLPATTGTTGQIWLGANRFLHGYGYFDTFLGPNAGNLTSTGYGNTGLGAATLGALTGGIANTAVGSESMSSNTIGSNNTALGYQSVYYSTTGTDNTALGYEALRQNTTASGNTAVGSNAGYANTTGATDTAVGVNGLKANTVGSDNVAVGGNALAANTTASGNTAIGSGALSTLSFDNGNNQWDSRNTAVGYQALYSDQAIAPTDANYNTGTGALVLYSNTTGAYNTANGYQSLYFNTTAWQNTAIGAISLQSNTTGELNTAVGYASLSFNTTGSFNTALGFAAGQNLTTGGSNIDIGNGGSPTDDKTIRIGSSSQARTFIAGIRGVTTGNADAVPVVIDSAGQLGTISSSIRFKKDVADMGAASSRLMELRPVMFHYKSQPDGPLEYGLIAEEVEKVMPELVVRDATGQVETVAYQELPAMLLNELQKQEATITDQSKTIQAQQATAQRQQAEIEELTARLTALESRSREHAQTQR